MQKKIIALAIAAAFAAPVAAMADVTMYGSIDAGLRHQTNDAAATGTTDSMQLGQYNSTRWGLKSSEDMGDGMKTNVVLEGSLTTPVAGPSNSITSATGQGNGIFDRQATIGVNGGFGNVDIGWNYTASFKTIVKYDPFNYKFLGVAMAKTSDYQDRAGGVSYDNKFGDVSVIAEYYMPNASATTQPSTGAGRAAAVNYASGPISVGASYTAVESNAGVDTPLTHTAAGAGFNFGDGNVKVGYAKKAIKTAANDNTTTTMWLGADFNISSKMAVTGAYYTRVGNTGVANALDSTSKTLMVGLTYALSKKTTMYVEMDKNTANTGATASTADTIITGTSLGLATAF